MKRYLLAISVAMFAAVSCSKLAVVSESDASGKMTIFASLNEQSPLPAASYAQTKTVIGEVDGNTLRVMFTGDDNLLVYGQGESDVKSAVFTAVGDGVSESKNFSCKNWPEGYSAIYAVATKSTSSLNECTDAGVIKMLVNNSRQKLDRSDSYATNATAHVGQVLNEAVYLKNVCSLIGFRISGKNDITKIELRGNNDEDLGGWISVDYSKIDSDPAFYSVDNGVKRITVTAEESIDGVATNGCIPVDKDFYISVLPGIYANGFTIAMTDKDGKVAVRRIQSPINLNRAKVRKFSAPINDGVVFETVAMPDDLVFTFGTKWPFVESIVPKEEQSGTGDNYSYDYSDPVSGWSGYFDFVICKGTSYAQNQKSQSLDFSGADSWMKLPAIEGRVLKSVVIKVRNSQNKTFDISDTSLGTAMKSGKVKDGGTLTLAWLDTDENKPVAGVSYYLNLRTSSTYCTEISVFYGLDGQQVQYPDEFTVDLNLTLWPFSPAPVEESSQTAEGEPYVYQFIGAVAGENYNFPLQFVLCKGPNNNTYSIKNSVLSFKRVGPKDDYSENLGYIKLPAVKDHYLKSVNLTINTTSTDVVLCKTAERVTEGDNLVKQFKAYKNTDSKSGDLSGITELNKSYYLYRLSTTAFNLINLKLTYAVQNN